MRILSGLQSSGILHLGNYFGAMKQHVGLQEAGEAFYFIANYHALTTIQDRERQKALTRDAALDYLAVGLDPHKATLFRQSDVPQVTELAWILATVTGMGLLERAHSYKDKVANNIVPSAGLFTYPLLMAADILIYQSDLVPVGADQVQHVEMTRDMAGYFNNTYGEAFKLPKPHFPTTGVASKVPGVDGRKMSKSYGNTLDIFDSGKPLRKKIMAIVTDSTPVESPKNPETCNIFQLYSLFATPEELAEMDANYRRGGYGYGHAKQALYEKMESYFAPMRERRAELLSHPSQLEEILQAGGERARATAENTMEKVRYLTGIK